MYTYACKKAIQTSKNVTNKINTKGTDEIIKNKKLVHNNPQTKPIKIFNKVCPAIILAKRRIDKLKTLAT
jgi:hypothetical protein